MQKKTRNESDGGHLGVTTNDDVSAALRMKSCAQKLKKIQNRKMKAAEND